MVERPQGWSDEEWAEYQAWKDSLPEDIEAEGSRHAVMVGDKSAITAPAEQEPEPEESEEEAESDQAKETPEEESDGDSDAEEAERGPS